MIDSTELRVEIIRKYGTQTKFAKAIKWPENKLSRLMQHRYIPDIQEVDELAKGLELSRERFFDIFLSDASPNGDEQKEDNDDRH